jgi:hypothetical protein
MPFDRARHDNVGDHDGYGEEEPEEHQQVEKGRLATFQQRDHHDDAKAGDDCQEADQDQDAHATDVPRDGLFIRLGDVNTQRFVFRFDGSTPSSLLPPEETSGARLHRCFLPARHTRYLTDPL